MAKERQYYYAGQDRIELEPVQDLVAVDAGALGRGKQDSALKRRLAGKQPIARDVYLVERKELTDADLDRLDQMGIVHPVFKYGTARIVVLPEVRASLEHEADVKTLRRLLSQPKYDAEIVRQSGRRVVLRPASGRGLDALALANRLKEEGEASTAQARFVRMLPKPDVSRKPDR